MIQETEMKQRLARMVGLLRSFQFMNLTLEQDVQVQLISFQYRLGEAL